MSKIWKHEVSVDWLQARRDVLTASEIKAMLPEYKRMLKKPSGTVSPGFYALCGAKLSVDIPDPSSVGAAARGHIMEPYAIADWNANMGKTDQYEHWDDIVIKRNGVGYSPDGLDYEQLGSMGVELWVGKDKKLYTPEGKCMLYPPTRAIEVKCYEPKQHMKSFLEDKDGREERLQVAVAFMVLPSLKHADILWYCPEAPVPMFFERYKKSDLKEEISVITNMVKMFHWHMDKVEHDMADWSRGGMVPAFTTDFIYNEWMKEQSASIKI